MEICVVGMGYVGLPLAVQLSKHFDVTGFDISKEKVEQLKKGSDPSGELSNEELSKAKVNYTTDPSVIKDCNFIIVCVPTPIDEETMKPDLSHLESSSKTVGEHLRKNSIVVYESTVYPGVTEEICGEILEETSGLKLGVDFKLGYSPERVNPGDKSHTIDKVVKIVSGMDKESLEKIDSVYSKITKTHKAPAIKVAEGAKVIENIQRDLNIALMNELQVLFDEMGVNFKHVLEAAGTKWNFHKYNPGLVGGHCIPVDPYYLTYKAQQIGFDPKVILAGRKTNDNMFRFYADKIVESLTKQGKTISGSSVLIMGLTFKPNVSDYRNSKVKDLIRELQEHGINVLGCDPLLSNNIVKKIFGIENNDFENVKDVVDLIVLTVEHDQFKNKITDDMFRLWK